MSCETDGAAASAPAAACDEDAEALDERDAEPRTPMKRLGSTRKLAAFNNIRAQLAEQRGVLEARAEASAGAAAELHDYCRRRAELEHEYARALDKLARAAQRRPPRDAPVPAPAAALHAAALEAARALARDHAALADLYGGALSTRLQRAADDALRLHRKCRDLLLERHEELAAALHAAGAAAKEHAALQAAWRAQAAKLRAARAARQDPPKHKKLKALDKELEKRRARHAAARVRALRARADLVLCLEAANATLQRYYLDDVADIVLSMEVGFEAVVGRVARCMADAESARGASAAGAAAALRRHADALDAPRDRARLFSANAAAFAPPRPLPAAPPPDLADDEPDPAPDDPPCDEELALRAELDARRAQLEAAARRLRAECQESAKTLDAAEAELLRQAEGDDAHWDAAPLFGSAALGAAATPQLPPQPPLAEEQEDYYLAKLRAYVAGAGRLARLESKAGALRAGAALGPGPAPGAVEPLPRRAPSRRAGAAAVAPDAPLPRVLTECVRVISERGMRQQGLFRVSGSALEVASLRAAFERGEEPLGGARAGAELHSVCGLLKAYLRGARATLLPPALAERLARLAALPAGPDWAPRVRGTLAALPLSSLLVLRFLFAFLAALAARARHTMMDAWNLAICVGPTLLAAPPAPADQLQHQNLLNELVKRIILQHREVFPQDVAPHTLYVPPPSSDSDSDSEEAPLEPEAAPAQDRTLDGARDGARDAAPGPERDAIDRGVPPDSLENPDPAPAPAHAPASAPAPSATPPPRRLAKSTPDLVLDLPAAAAAALGAPAPSAGVTAPPASEAAPGDGAAPPDDDAADTFAHNRDTLKKRPPHRIESGDGVCSGATAESGAGAGVTAGAGGSPGAARHTARVCAQFAELTLTGGSLKPALAAKPRLLRRPAAPLAPVAPVAPALATPAPAAPADTDESIF